MRGVSENKVKQIPALITRAFHKRSSLALKGLSVAGALLLLLSGNTPHANAQHYGVTIVTPPAIQFVSPVIFFAADMNNNGDVIATTGNNIYRAFGWSANSGSVELPFDRPFNFSSTYGYGVSDVGDYVGEDGYSRPAVYRSGTQSNNILVTGLIPLPGFPGTVAPYFGQGQGLAVSGTTGLVAGWGSPVDPGAISSSGAKHAYAWPSNSTFVDMGGGPFGFSIAYSVNSHNNVAGIVQTAQFQDVNGITRTRNNGFVQSILDFGVFFAASGKILLPTLGGDSCFVAQINDSDLVAGSTQTASGLTHACLWDPDQFLPVVTDLTPLDSTPSYAHSINNGGVVVGQRTVNGARGFLWDSVHGMQDLNTMLPAGWSCYDAIKINDNGQILANCVFNGIFSVVVLTPQPTPTLSGLNPSTVAGATAVSPFTVTGTNFTASSKIHVHQIFPGGTLDQDLATTFDSPTQLHTSILANLLTHTDNVAVTVLDPVRGPTGGLTLTVTQGAIPTLAGVTPNPVPVGTAVPKLTVTGTNFKAASKIHLYQITGFNGSDFTFINLDLPTTYDSANQLHTSIPANLLSLYSGAYITVIDPVLGAGPGLSLSVVGVPKISISSVVATRIAGPGSSLSVLITFANTGTADALNATVSAASQLKLNGVNTTTGTPFTIDAIYTGQGILVTFPGSILPGNRVLSLTMSYDGGSFTASKLVVIP